MADTLELAGENPFKVRAFRKAADTLGQSEYADRLVAMVADGSLVEIPGIGKGILAFLQETAAGRVSPDLEAALKKIPQGLRELTRVPGLGPKKARVVVDQLGIQTLGELEYACKENRLLKLDGFGEKLQTKILASVQFLLRSVGKALLSDSENWADAIESKLKEPDRALAVRTGSLARRDEVLSELEWVASADVAKKIEKAADAVNPAVRVEVHRAEVAELGVASVRRSSAPDFWKALEKRSKEKLDTISAGTETEFFKKAGTPFLAPEFRGSATIFDLLDKPGVDSIVREDDVRGVFHAHTTRSDGHDSLEEMTRAAHTAGFEYFGVSDHSQSAFYAHGLSAEDLKAQRKECEAAQKKVPACRIFWGIESDILKDGSLDYSEKVLGEFDFVIASIHSRFGLGRKDMTDRIVKALKHPRTRILGHVTGRLLLGREGYDIDMEEIIKVASHEGKAIEINAHPQRLDIDWRWGDALRKHKTWVAINPDAHEKEGIRDFRYGVAMARKALLPKTQILNALNTKEVASWLKS